MANEQSLTVFEAFILKFCKEMRRTPRRLAPQVRALLLSQPFPGNRCTCFCSRQILRDARLHFDRDCLQRALAHFSRRKVETARALGISRKNLWGKIQRPELEPYVVTAG